MHNIEYSAVPETIITNYIDGVGNMETKILMGSLFLLHNDLQFTGSEMAYAMNVIQALPTARKLSEGNIASYCKKSVEPIGELIEGTGPWRAKQDFIAERLALSGLFLDWSHTYDTISVQQLYGAGRTNKPAGERGPYARQKVYELLSRESLTQATVFERIGHGRTGNVFKNMIGSMIDASILEKHRANHHLPTLNTLSLAPAMQKPVKALVDGIAAIRSRTDIGKYARLAAEFVDDPRSCRDLIAKARDFASANHALRKVAYDQLEELFATSQDLTIAEAHTLLNNKAPIYTSRIKVGEALAGLATNGILEATRAEKTGILTYRRLPS